MDIDLNLDNYELNDIINLFGISYNFNEAELKKAKRIVLQTHPDKSGLDKKFFLFFTSAYKIIHAIYKFRYKIKNAPTDYKTLDDKRNDEIVKKLFQKMNVKANGDENKNAKEFNKWFNELFEKTKISDEYTETGYGDWLKSNEDLDEFEKINKQDMDVKIEEKKKKMAARAIQKHKDFTESQTSCYELTREKPEYYSSDLFSKLNFDDVKKAHQESVIPVSQEDYQNKAQNRGFNNLQELQAQRSRKLAPTSLEQSREFLKQQADLDATNDTQRAYKLVKQDEQVQKANDKWWGNLRRLT